MKPKLYTARYVLPITAPPIEDGALLVTGSKIRAVGLRKELAAARADAEVVDYGDSVLLPPMVNAHTHLELTHFADWARLAGEAENPQNFVDWILRLVRVRRTVGSDKLQESLISGLNASLCAGTGAVGDILSTLDIAGAYRHLPLAGKAFAEVLGHDHAAVSTRLANIADLFDDGPETGLDWGLSPHSPYTLSSAALEQVFAFTRKHNLQACIHLAESREESFFLQDGAGDIAEKLYPAAKWDHQMDSIPGCSPVKALCQQQKLKAHDLVVHGVQVDIDDVALLKQAGCTVVLCPRSNAALGVGKAPVADYVRAGVPLAIGTDSLASAPSVSVWEELAFAQQWFSSDLKADKWLEIATLGGAIALGLNGRMGALGSGYEASFQVLSLPGMPEMVQLESALCNAGDAVKVTHLYLSGRNVLP
jgi:cytosine/adenosine deaminase-related metal-dependent hydrolase